MPNGAIDVNECLEAPLIGSLPHFLTGDKELHEMFDGLSPNEEKHAFAYDFDLVNTKFNFLRLFALYIELISLQDDFYE